MHIQFRIILAVASLTFALAIWFPNEVSADEVRQAKVTQVIQDVRILPSNASPRPAAVNDNVHQGTAVQTGVQSRSFMCRRNPVARRSKWGQSPRRSPGKQISCEGIDCITRAPIGAPACGGRKKLKKA
ncbi:MAG: hypothetical protein DME87_09330 [Verrucomicrobia bacterium]|nr:MAG: hypothetical protein DME87_09330 [Verrucomicrobiota bacterium]